MRGTPGTLHSPETAMDGETIYEIRVRGHLDSGWGKVLGLELTREGGHTVMVGALDFSWLTTHRCEGRGPYTE